jgi:hypothetical protein
MALCCSRIGHRAETRLELQLRVDRGMDEAGDVLCRERYGKQQEHSENTHGQSLVGMGQW